RGHPLMSSVVSVAQYELLPPTRLLPNRPRRTRSASHALSTDTPIPSSSACQVGLVCDEASNSSRIAGALSSAAIRLITSLLHMVQRWMSISSPSRSPAYLFLPRLVVSPSGSIVARQPASRSPAIRQSRWRDHRQ